MALLLNIDTATQFASVGFSRDGQIIGMEESSIQGEHASFLQPAIERLSVGLGLPLSRIDAIAVTIGPGSYTGLRVGLAGAKGIAYALDKPLITVGTLPVMALAAEEAWSSGPGQVTVSVQGPEPAEGALMPLYCPMIDARRDEVYGAIYASGGVPVLEPASFHLSESVFLPFLTNKLLIFSGDGAIKWKGQWSHSAARFLLVQHSVAQLARLAEVGFRTGAFASLAYTEPLYLKEFHQK